jgi:arylsulfatase A-like enzyme
MNHAPLDGERVGQTPFRGEKATCWEGGFRVPKVIRWPGVIKPGTIIDDMCAQ